MVAEANCLKTELGAGSWQRGSGCGRGKTLWSSKARLVWADVIDLRLETHREYHVEWEKRPMKVHQMVGDPLWKESENYIEFLRSIGQFGIRVGLRLLPL
jgi:hypothetical protein